jgi:hypothetical protein
MQLRYLVPLALVLGLLCAAASTFVVRPANDRVIVGMGCAQTDLNPHGLCIANRPRGGFPLIHISDDARAANRGRLGLEDAINPIAVAGNTAAYAALWLAGLGALLLVRARRSTALEAAAEKRRENSETGGEPKQAQAETQTAAES